MKGKNIPTNLLKGILVILRIIVKKTIYLDETSIWLNNGERNFDQACIHYYGSFQTRIFEWKER
ncbi:MAG: hypothetical protein Pg6B_07120 [Candidatus Azobacteroides pseudotrichonymphae]|jgi:hypothetical protein|nr:MAG: hypothetical protein Pg6B_07120 [Candidatus Azobacteroides pseudotrichonymphae]